MTLDKHKYLCKKCSIPVIIGGTTCPIDGLCARCGGRECPAPDCGRPKQPESPTCPRAQCRDWAKRRLPAYSTAVAQFKRRQ